MDSFPNSSADVLNDLDPLSRALLDLSIQRGMDDAEIAQVLGTDEDSVFEVRVGLLRNVAEQVAPEHAEADLPELQTAVAERLYPEDETTGEPDAAEAEPEPEAEPQLEAVPEAVAEPEPDREPAAASPTPATTSRRRSWLPIIVPIVLLVAVVAVIVAAGSGDDGDDQAGKPPAQTPSTQASTPDTTPQADGPKPIPLTALGSGGATGTATLDNGRLTMTLGKLPEANGATYTVWLYNSVIDAKRIGVVKNGKVVAKLPKDADKYRYLDVSREPNDGNPNHSGQSVVRVPLRKLQS